MPDDAVDDAVVVTLHPGDKYRPDGVVDTTKRLGWLTLSDEESRRVDKTYGAQHANGFTTEELLAKAVRFGAPDKILYLYEHIGQLSNTYFGYDGITGSAPVNQVPDVRKWEAHLARIAHDVDQFNIDTSEFRRPDTFKSVPVGSHSAETQIRNQNTLQVFRSMIGDALRRLDGWAAIDPTVTGSNSWSELREGIRAIIEDKVCQACEHHYSAREFARLHDYSAWRTALDHRRELDNIGSVFMRVPMIDRSSVPWSPHPTENLAWFGGTQVDEGWRRAVEWYDEAIHRYDRTYAERYPTT